MGKENDDLKKYKEKRNTNKSGEPEGKKSKSNKNRFSFQKHDAQNLHYDFRLECDGVLKSWAIPKGPSTDTSEKRLAIRTEDHPVDYIHFEGKIPEDEYGAGPVLLWDKGTYKNITEKDDEIKDLKKAIDDGHFLVDLDGEKIKGGYAFTRTDKDEGQWLMVKMDDDKADARRNPTSTEPESVKSGKKIEDIDN
ncbi:DNA polymerase ligase N-terminal domain-containing protein [Mangrovivirga cuniculi]|uniref:DNA ligase n=1 Tax=Mangrovivirga cuniculi TaxID=2715131 RepID=A0A4D7JPD0_9BACT|nr:DNA polymerase ligase N-terminal domain-containing protein [Mangrovivirga cuniculi]QCK16623.1 DNA ligase [Mangrovivirga cuniculi]